MTRLAAAARWITRVGMWVVGAGTGLATGWLLAGLFGLVPVLVAAVIGAVCWVAGGGWEHWRDGGTRSWADYASALHEDIDTLQDDRAGLQQVVNEMAGRLAWHERKQVTR